LSKSHRDTKLKAKIEIFNASLVEVAVITKTK
jgi:hypothetical protein